MRFCPPPCHHLPPPQVVVATSGGRVTLLGLSEGGGVALQGEITLGAEVACLDITPLGGS